MHENACCEICFCFCENENAYEKFHYCVCVNANEYLFNLKEFLIAIKPITSKETPTKNSAK